MVRKRDSNGDCRGGEGKRTDEKEEGEREHAKQGGRKGESEGGEGGEEEEEEEEGERRRRLGGEGKKRTLQPAWKSKGVERSTDASILSLLFHPGTVLLSFPCLSYLQDSQSSIQRVVIFVLARRSQKGQKEEEKRRGAR